MSINLEQWEFVIRRHDGPIQASTMEIIKHATGKAKQIPIPIKSLLQQSYENLLNYYVHNLFHVTFQVFTLCIIII